MVAMKRITLHRICQTVFFILENKDNRDDIRPIVESVIDSILTMAVEIIEKNQLHLEKINNEHQQQMDVVNRLTSDYKCRIKCKTGDTLTTLYVPKIQTASSKDDIIEAKNFVEEYEEFHGSCSELQDAEIAIGQVISELSANVENAIMERQRNKKKKVKTCSIIFCVYVNIYLSILVVLVTKQFSYSFRIS